MIVFNSVSLDSVAPVMIEDIRVSPVKLNPVVRPRAVQFGANFVRMGGGERTVAVTFAILERNEGLRHEYLMNISEWAKTDQEYRLELPTDPNRYLMGVCTAKPEPSTRLWWENKLRLVFTCYENPFWTAKDEKTVNCGTAFNVLGDAPPLMKIVLSLGSAQTNKVWNDGTNYMTFSDIPAGDLVIDLNNQTAAVGNTSIMQYYAASGHFIVPKTGAMTINGVGSVKYRERWQ